MDKPNNGTTETTVVNPGQPERNAQQAQSNTALGTAITPVSVTLTDTQQRAMRKLALRSSKKSASELAQDWLGQRVKQMFKAAFKSEEVKKELEAQYKRYEQMNKDFGQPVTITLEDFIKRSMTEVDEIYANL